MDRKRTDLVSKLCSKLNRVITRFDGIRCCWEVLLLEVVRKYYRENNLMYFEMKKI